MSASFDFSTTLLPCIVGAVAGVITAYMLRPPACNCDERFALQKVDTAALEGRIDVLEGRVAGLARMDEMIQSEVRHLNQRADAARDRVETLGCRVDALEVAGAPQSSEKQLRALQMRVAELEKAQALASVNDWDADRVHGELNDELRGVSRPAAAPTADDAEFEKLLERSRTAAAARRGDGAAAATRLAEDLSSEEDDGEGAGHDGEGIGIRAVARGAVLAVLPGGSPSDVSSPSDEVTL